MDSAVPALPSGRPARPGEVRYIEEEAAAIAARVEAEVLSLARKERPCEFA